MPRKKTELFRKPWNSVSFQGRPLAATRPGFGVILTLAPDQCVHELRDVLSHLFSLRTKDEAMHVTLFSVVIEVYDPMNYDPTSLPNDLLVKMKEHVFSSAEKCVRECGIDLDSHRATVHPGSFYVMGTAYPSHLAVAVDFSDVSANLNLLSDYLNDRARSWVRSTLEVALREDDYEIETRMEGADFVLDCKSGKWLLRIRGNYTDASAGNWFQRKHVTLGVLTTGDAVLDELVVNQHVARTAEEAVLDEDEHDEPFSSVSRECRDGSSEWTTAVLRRVAGHFVGLEPVEIGDGRKRWRELHEEWSRVRSWLSEFGSNEKKEGGRMEIERVHLTNKVIDQWCEVVQNRLAEEIKRCCDIVVGSGREPRHLRLGKLVGRVIDFYRTPNYELPVGSKKM